jgi:hypothetical protein
VLAEWNEPCLVISWVFSDNNPRVPSKIEFITYDESTGRIFKLFPLGMTAVVGISSRTKYSSAANKQSTFPLQFDLPHFIVESEIV